MSTILVLSFFLRPMPQYSQLHLFDIQMHCDVIFFNSLTPCRQSLNCRYAAKFVDTYKRYLCLVRKRKEGSASLALLTMYFMLHRLDNSAKDFKLAFLMNV